MDGSNGWSQRGYAEEQSSYKVFLWPTQKIDIKVALMLVYYLYLINIFIKQNQSVSSPSIVSTLYCYYNCILSLI